MYVLICGSVKQLKRRQIYFKDRQLEITLNFVKIHFSAKANVFWLSFLEIQ
jgi:hypothetical protein